MKTRGINVDLNHVGTVVNSRVVDRLPTPLASVNCAWFRNVALVASSLTLVGCGVLGSGNGSSEDFNDRIYIGAGVLISELEPDTDDVPGIDVSETSSGGGSLTLGYDINPRFSIEGHVADLGEAELGDDGNISYQVGGISGLAYFNDEYDRSRREGLSIYGRLGLGTLSNDSDNVPFERLNDFNLLAGIGLEYGLEMGLGIRAELVAHDTDAQYAQLGLVYRFGDAGESTPRSRPVAPAEVEQTPKAVPVPAPTNTIVDSDSDGVLDPVDRCPDTASGRPVDETGCDIFGGVIEGVNFESGSDALTQDAQTILTGVAGTLADYPDVVVSIEAHTDNQGAAAGNLDLSRRRALSVARYLVSEGVAGSRLRAKAFGESQPRASNATAAGRSQNRRVEFKIVE